MSAKRTKEWWRGVVPSSSPPHTFQTENCTYLLVLLYSAFILHSYHNSVQYNTYSMSKTQLFIFRPIWTNYSTDYWLQSSSSKLLMSCWIHIWRKSSAVFSALYVQVFNFHILAGVWEGTGDTVPPPFVPHCSQRLKNSQAPTPCHTLDKQIHFLSHAQPKSL
jgi:hypothetical protein